jgi:hypothetical protein
MQRPAVVIDNGTGYTKMGYAVTTPTPPLASHLPGKLHPHGNGTSLPAPDLCWEAAGFLHPTSAPLFPL